MSEDSKYIGRFPLSDTLGIGGMGIVYAAHDPDIGRKVAIKVLHSTGNPIELERFKNEARTIGKLAHPNIVVLLEYGIDDNKPFLVMEYLPGQSLESWVEKSHKLSEHKELLIGLCQALKYAHEKDILHRDLKPGNVQVLPGGQAKLLDFGIAQGKEKGLTASGVVMGTPKYLAPEVLQNETHTKSSDCYSLSLIAYTMLSGRNPFSADSFHAAVIQQLTLTPPPLHKLNPEVPKKLSDIIEQYLAKDPENRPVSLDLLEQALKSIRSEAELNRNIVPVKGDSGSDDTLKTLAFQTEPKKKGTNKLLLGLGFGVAAIAIISSFLLGSFTSMEPEKNTPILNPDEAKQTQLPIVGRVKAKPAAEIKTNSKSLNKDLRNKPYTQTSESDEINSDDTTTTKSQKTRNITLVDEVIEEQKVEKNESQPEPFVSKAKITVSNKPAISPKKTLKKPVKKQVMTTSPAQNTYIQKSETTPIVVLPTLNLNQNKIVISSATDLEISRGKTKKIILNVPYDIEINEFIIYRAGKELKLIKIRNVQHVSDGKIQLHLYADNNAILGVYSIYGIYKGKKTTAVTLKVTL